MGQHSSAQRALDHLEKTWAAQGYTVIRELSEAAIIPTFFGKYRPDAIGVGKTPYLAIEVVNPLSPSTETKLRQLQSLFSGREDWKLEVVYLASDDTQVDRSTNGAIQAALEKIGQVAAIDTRAALLLGWAVIEAIGRAVNPEDTVKVLSPRSLVDLLVSQGHVSQADGTALRHFASMRNRLVHGQIEPAPTPYEIQELVHIAQSVPLPN